MRPVPDQLLAEVLKYLLLALGILAAALIFLSPVYFERRRRRILASGLKRVFDGREALDELRFHEKYFRSRGVPFYVSMKIRKMLEEESGLEMSRLRAEDNFYENLAFLFQAERLDGVELVMRIEEEFDISLADDEVRRARTIADLTMLVWAKVQLAEHDPGPAPSP